MKVLISSSVREGLEEPSRKLVDSGFEILATKGTAEYLAERGIKVRRLSEITGIEESRELKTLHPKIYEMIFSGEVKAVVVIPYRFEESPGVENIDIGGISLLRAAAKAGILAAYDLDSFQSISEVLIGGGKGDDSIRAKIFRFTSEYDRRIAEWFEERDEAP